MADVGGKYNAVGADTAAAPKVREAAMLMVLASQHLLEEDFDEVLKAGSQALELFRAAGDAAGVADALRAMVSAHCGLEDVAEALKVANEELEAFRSKGNKMGEASMLLSSAEVCTSGSKIMEIEKVTESSAQALAIFREAGDKAMEAVALLGLAQVQLALGTKSHVKVELSNSVDTFEQALAAFQGLGDKIGQAKAQHGTATARVAQRSPDDALDSAKDALASWKDAGVRRMEAVEMVWMADVQLDAFLPDEALTMGQKALDIFEELGTGKGWQATAISKQILAYLAMKDTAQALKLAEAALKRFERARDDLGEATALEMMCSVHIANGDHKEALIAADNALQVVRSMTNPKRKEKQWEARLLHQQGVVHLADEQFAKANQQLNAALKLFKEAENDEEQGNTLVTLSNANMGMQEESQALRVANDARSLFKRSNHRSGVAFASLGLSSVYAWRGDLKKATALAKEAVSICTGERERKGEVDALFMLAQVQMLSEDFESAMKTAQRGRGILKEMSLQKEEFFMSILMARGAFFVGVQDKNCRGKKPTPAWDRALKESKDVLALSRKLKNDDFTAQALTVLGQTHVMRGETDDAVATFTEALDLRQQAVNQKAEAHLNIAMCQLFGWDEKNDIAKTYAEKALELLKLDPDPEGEALAQELLQWLASMQPGAAVAVEGAVYSGPSMDMLVNTVTDVALSLMGIESLATDTPLMDAGLDSLASVEFQNTLAKEFAGANIPSTLMFDFPSPKIIADFLYGELRAAEGFAKEN